MLVDSPIENLTIAANTSRSVVTDDCQFMLRQTILQCGQAIL